MKKVKTIILPLFIVVLIACGYFAYMFYMDAVNYFTTENASVTADTVTITPQVTGNVISWLVKEGDDVAKGQILGNQDLGLLMSSSAVNVQSLTSSADSLVAKADIKSPIDGKVVQSNVMLGETIAPGMTIAIVADTNNMYINANVEETDINRIKTGQKVIVTIDACGDEVFTGYVESIGQATQSAFSIMPSLNTSGTYSKVVQLIPVKIAIADNDKLPKTLGLNATVKIRTR